MITDTEQVDATALEDLQNGIGVYTYVTVYNENKKEIYTIDADDLAISNCCITEGTTEAGILIGNVITKELQLKVFIDPEYSSHTIKNGYILSVSQTVGTAGLTRGNSIKKGEYIVTSVETTSECMTVKAYDYMYNADEVYIGTTGDVFDLTTVIGDICEQIGCTYDDSNIYDIYLLNGNQYSVFGTSANPSYVIPDGATCKELLESMAVICCANVRIDGNNVIQFIRNGNGTYFNNPDIIVDLTDNMEDYSVEYDDTVWVASDGTLGSYIIPNSTIKFTVGEDDDSVSYYWSTDESVQEQLEAELEDTQTVPTSLPDGLTNYYELNTVISLTLEGADDDSTALKIIPTLYATLMKQVLSRFSYQGKYSYYYLIYAFEIKMYCNPLIECWDFINIIKDGDTTHYSYINEVTYNFMGITTIKNTSS